MRTFNCPRLKPLVLALTLFSSSWKAYAAPVDLHTAWRSAQQHDKELAAARADYAASQTRREQARAMWRPMVMATGAAGVGGSEVQMKGAQFSAPSMGPQPINGADFSTSINRGTLTRLGLMVQQPLIDGERLANSRQLRIAADMGELMWQGAQAKAMLDTSQRYFDLALAQENSRILQRQIEAVQRTVDEMHMRFNLGEVTVTDTHEVDAAIAGLKAMQASLAIDLANKRRILADSTGLPDPEALLPAKNHQPFAAIKAAYASEEAWMQAVQEHNVQLKMGQQGLEMANQEVRKTAPFSGVSLNLVGQAGQDRIRGNGDFGSASNRNTNYMVGVQLTIPLFTGGWRSAKRAEAVHLQEKAQMQRDQGQDTVMQQARMLWAAQEANQARIAALETAAKASSLRLDATRMGRSLGDRTTLDVLNAETQRATAEQALAQARVDSLMNQLRMAAMVNQLDDARLTQISTPPKPEPVSAAKMQTLPDQPKPMNVIAPANSSRSSLKKTGTMIETATHVSINYFNNTGAAIAA
jgi:outer membrane protein